MVYIITTAATNCSGRCLAQQPDCHSQQRMPPHYLTAPKGRHMWFRARGKVPGLPRQKLSFGIRAMSQSHMGCDSGVHRFPGNSNHLKRPDSTGNLHVLGEKSWECQGCPDVFRYYRGSGRARRLRSHLPYLGAGLRFLRTPVKPVPRCAVPDQELPGAIAAPDDSPKHSLLYSTCRQAQHSQLTSVTAPPKPLSDLQSSTNSTSSQLMSLEGFCDIDDAHCSNTFLLICTFL